MDIKTATRLAERFGGWREGDTLYFPSPDLRRQWEKSAAARVPA
jgi:hypothetical protein